MNLQLVLALAAACCAVALPARGLDERRSGGREGQLDVLAGAGSPDSPAATWPDQQASASAAVGDLARAAGDKSPLLQLLQLLADLLGKLLKHKQELLADLGLPAYSEITAIMPDLGLLGKLV